MKLAYFWLSIFAALILFWVGIFYLASHYFLGHILP